MSEPASNRLRPALLAALGLAALACAGVYLPSTGLLTQPGLALAEFPHGRLVKKLKKGTAFEQRIEGFTYTGTTDNYVDWFVYTAGAYELPELHLLRDLLTATGPDAVFVDIGANVGQYSLYASQYAKTVHAVEPFPPVLERMRAMIALNHLESKIVVHPEGYSDQPGSLPFFAPPDDNLGKGTFDASMSVDGKPTQELPLVRGDDDLAEHGVARVDLIKVDIEGYERLALEGMKQTIVRDRPTVLLERNDTEGSFPNRELLVSTFPPDYEFFTVGSPGVEELMMLKLGWWQWVYGPSVSGEWHLRPLSFDGQTNVLAVAKEKMATLNLHPGS